MIPPIKDAASKCCGGLVGAAAVDEVEIVVNTCEVVLLGDVELLCSVVVEDTVVLGGTAELVLVTVDGFVDVNTDVVTDGTVVVFVLFSTSLSISVGFVPWAIVESKRNKANTPSATVPTKNVYKSLFIFTASFRLLVFPDTFFLSL